METKCKKCEKTFNASPGMRWSDGTCTCPYCGGFAPYDEAITHLREAEQEIKRLRSALEWVFGCFDSVTCDCDTDDEDYREHHDYCSDYVQGYIAEILR